MVEEFIGKGGATKTWVVGELLFQDLWAVAFVKGNLCYSLYMLGSSKSLAEIDKGRRNFGTARL